MKKGPVIYDCQLRIRIEKYHLDPDSKFDKNQIRSTDRYVNTHNLNILDLSKKKKKKKKQFMATSLRGMSSPDLNLTPKK